MRLLDTLDKNRERPLVIAGPCSAESCEQMLATAKELNHERVDYYRAGIWKPRTRPGSFEGYGKKALPWLKEAKDTYGFRTCTEVAKTEHVEAALDADVDLLWVGARTTTNPFAVQEIAEALAGVDVEVLVKNPINPDLSLWMGGIERLKRKGITKIGAIHRGFSIYAKSNFRNQPLWQIPLELKRNCPDLPVICDPSHICGRRDIIFDVSQKALDLNFDGLMIETHINPDVALSDAAQQLTPVVYNETIHALELSLANPDSQSRIHLSEYRNTIDDLDTELLQILRSRMDIVEKIAAYKKEHKISIYQKERWDKILTKSNNKAEQMDLDTKFVQDIFRAIHQSSINLQEKIIRKR